MGVQFNNDIYQFSKLVFRTWLNKEKLDNHHSLIKKVTYCDYRPTELFQILFFLIRKYERSNPKKNHSYEYNKSVMQGKNLSQYTSNQYLKPSALNASANSKDRGCL